MTNTSNHSCAFLVIYLGKLPDYFDHWAKTCEPNHGNCHFFVYNDHIDVKQKHNKAVTLVPYSFEDLCSDLKETLNIHIHPQNTRIVCDCRVMLYPLRKEKDALDKFDFIGYTDLDVVYGLIAGFLPENPLQYSMICAHNNRPCGPFTLFNRNFLNDICRQGKLKDFFEASQDDSFYSGKAFSNAISKFMPMSGNTKKDLISEKIKFCHLDESNILIELAQCHAPVFCKSESLQPAMTKKINHQKTTALWENGHLYVKDNWGNKKEGAFFHFSRFKNRSRFKITKNALNADQLGIYKYGIIDAGSKLTRLKIFLTQLY
ncbi:MAG: hypothetical protein L3J69_07315 [Desulfobacula sp.]|nr:hypothetical protein [Desulfobacula sp.]